MTDDLITTDHPLTATQREALSVLLDCIIPASNDGHMPSAADVDLIGYLLRRAAEFIPELVQIVDHFDGELPALPAAGRHPAVQRFSEDQPELFNGLLLHVYTCYYEDERVLQGIGMAAGPPFPRGNSVAPGDLALLDPVVERAKSYRR